MKNITPAPYQLCFPIGILSSLLAVGIWLIADLQWFDTAPMLVHSRLILGGFLWSFIAGFLMTAVPRMTGTAYANRSELAIVSCLLFFQILSSWQMDGRWFYGSAIVLDLFLIVYGVKRIARSQKTLPVFFSHVGLGFLLALVGSIYHFNNDSYMGFHLYNIGSVLMLVLGIGTRFFSFLSGIPSTFEGSEKKSDPIIFHSLGVTIAGLLFLAGKGYSLAYLGIGLITLVYLLLVWRVQRRSTRSSPLKIAVRVVAAMIPLSFFLAWLQPVYYVTFFHLLFIGCFALITYSVATRVILAHGSYSLDLETKTRGLWVFITLLLLSLFFRTLYGFSAWPGRNILLHLAAATWITGIACWCYSFLVRIVKPGPLSKKIC